MYGIKKLHFWLPTLLLGVVTGWLGMSLEDGKLWWRDEVFEQVDQ